MGRVHLCSLVACLVAFAVCAEALRRDYVSYAPLEEEMDLTPTEVDHDLSTRGVSQRWRRTSSSGSGTAGGSIDFSDAKQAFSYCSASSTAFPVDKLDGMFKDHKDKVTTLAPYKIYSRWADECTSYPDCDWTYPDHARVYKRYRARQGLNGTVALFRRLDQKEYNVQLRSCPPDQTDPAELKRLGSCSPFKTQAAVSSMNCGSTLGLAYGFQNSRDKSWAPTCESKRFLYTRNPMSTENTQTIMTKDCLSIKYTKRFGRKPWESKRIEEYVVVSDFSEVEFKAGSGGGGDIGDQTLFEQDKCAAQGTPIGEDDAQDFFKFPTGSRSTWVNMGVFQSDIRIKKCNSRGCDGWRRYSRKDDGLASQWLAPNADEGQTMIHGFQGYVYMKRSRKSEGIKIDLLTTSCKKQRLNVLTGGELSDGRVTFDHQTYGLSLEYLHSGKCKSIYLLSQPASKTTIGRGTLTSNCFYQKYAAVTDEWGTTVEVVVHSTLNRASDARVKALAYKEEVRKSEAEQLGSGKCLSQSEGNKPALTAAVASKFFIGLSPQDNLAPVTSYRSFVRWRSCHQKYGCRVWNTPDGGRGTWLRPRARKYHRKLMDGWVGKIFAKRRSATSVELILNGECKRDYTSSDNTVTCSRLTTSNSTKAKDATKCSSSSPSFRLWQQGLDDGYNCEAINIFPNAHVASQSSVVSESCMTFRYFVTSKPTAPGWGTYWEWDIVFVGDDVEQVVSAVKARRDTNKYVPSPAFAGELCKSSSASALSQSRAMSYFTHPLDVVDLVGFYDGYARERKCHKEHGCSEWVELDPKKRTSWFKPSSGAGSEGSMSSFRGTMHFERNKDDEVTLVLFAKGYYAMSGDGDRPETLVNEPIVVECVPPNGDVRKKTWDCSEKGVQGWYFDGDKFGKVSFWNANLERKGRITAEVNRECVTITAHYKSKHNAVSTSGNYKERTFRFIGTFKPPPKKVPLPKDDTESLPFHNAFSPKNCPASEAEDTPITKAALDAVIEESPVDPKTNTRSGDIGTYEGYFRHRKCHRRGCGVWEYPSIGSRSEWRKPESFGPEIEIVGWEGLMALERDEGSKRHQLYLRCNYCETQWVAKMPNVLKCNNPLDIKCGNPSLFRSKPKSQYGPKPRCYRRSDLPFTSGLYRERKTYSEVVASQKCFKALYHVETDPSSFTGFWHEMEVAFTSDMEKIRHAP